METVRFLRSLCIFIAVFHNLAESKVQGESITFRLSMETVRFSEITVHFHSCVLETSRIQGESIISRLSLDAPYLLKEVCITIAV